KTKEKIRSYGVERYINIVPTGIDFSRFNLQQLDQTKLQELRQKWMKPGEKVLLSLGRVAKEKSMDMIIRGFAAYLKTQAQPARLLMVGDGPDRHDLMQLTTELGLDKFVSFVGAVPIQEVPYYYQLADVFVSASLTETQGLTFMEAMVSHRIVLCRFDENLASLIRHQQTGFIFTDAEDFARQVNAIFQLTEAKKTSMMLEMESAVKPYALSTFYENLLEVYQRATRQYW
ncbi:MAG: glycosyltransferase, partial [Bacilli bacterium]